MDRKIKGIIFDLDGVLCSTDMYHYRAWRKITDREGIYFDEEINKRTKGVSRRDALNIILEKSSRNYTEQEKQDLMDQKNRIYVDMISQMTADEETETVRCVLQELKNRGFRLAVGSSSKNAKFILKRLGLLDLFDAVSDGTNAQRAKPDPQIFLMAAEMLGLEPEACLVVEDAVNGIEAAVSGGFHHAGIKDAGRYHKTEHRLLRFSDLLNIRELSA